MSSLVQPVNLNSLNVVKSELLAAVNQAGSQLEAYIGNRDKIEFMQGSLAGLKEILGILQVIQLSGSELLTQEMIDLAAAIPAGAAWPWNTGGPKTPTA